ncbi:MAG: CidA/LrgA family protein [Alcaligenaceae bacterium]|uniref:CidA/LrgA family protein n=1 Tax=Advenella mandrilli TaxID=2800330 RepID=A0ABS1EE20_9BURK|nr:CidA/LrgA family protein [Advenella mandrilli]MBK1781368.1 CidA/LrgA family protein [Advenella mandrilli]NLY65151.1 CidA/LrgA family protein [Alcaligenaceae bacterium]
MLLTLAILCFFQAVGEWVSVLSGLPIPGPVLGMVFLFITLLLEPRLNHHIAASSEQLLRSMMIMFIPVCVGIMTSYTLLKGQWLALVAAIVISTVLAMAVGALVMQKVMKRLEKQARDQQKAAPDVE